MSMAEEDSKSESTLPASPIVEVLCKSSRKTSRFAVGSKAGFAVSLINRKLEDGAPVALYIEAVKDGEEPISFGPDAVLVNYGEGWKLQTVTELDYGLGIRKKEHVQLIPTQILNKVRTSDGTHSTKAVVKPGISFLYIAKILVAFGLIFVLGAIFTLALENLPRLLLFVNTLT
ncbi:hypothetical protein K2173_025588 [Erythroxylum novogranatense]|uniref:Uncharacterized protein n=1 Tax=Erythroxylum novogranatense TaxID=1862640 RepID=A0AAV8TAH8_9ROSI|nr:hypothetical protein K2173_025588 [Erythroxylum novogranatense]